MYYAEAIKIANIFGCRVAIVRNDNDGPGCHWETISEALTGGFSAACGHTIADIVVPNDPRFTSAKTQT